jgi:hypothetical protein
MRGAARAAAGTALNPVAASADSERGDHTFNPVAVTVRTGHLHGAVQADQHFKPLLAILADIFIDWHVQPSSILYYRPCNF